MGLELAKIYVTVRADVSKLKADFNRAKAPLLQQAANMGKVAGKHMGAALIASSRPVIQVGMRKTGAIVARQAEHAGTVAGKRMGVAFTASSQPVIIAGAAKTGAAINTKAATMGAAAGKSFSTGFSGKLGFAVLGFLAVKEAVMFEKSMIDVRANARLMGEEGAEAFQKLIDVARELGATTQFTAMQASASLNRLVLGGLNVKEAAAAVPAVLNLAASANLELARSAQIVVDNMRKYNMAASDTGKIADLLSSAQSRAQRTAQEFAEGLESLGSIAPSMNISFEEMLALLVTGARAGSDMRKAGTALAIGLSRLARAPKKTAEGLELLNVELQDFVRPDNTVNVMKLFRAIAEGMPIDPFKRGAVVMNIFGERGREILGVLNQFAKGRFAEETLAGFMEDVGRAARIAEAKMSTFWGTLKKVRSVAGELAIAGLTPVLEAMEPLLFIVRSLILATSEVSAMFGGFLPKLIVNVVIVRLLTSAIFKAVIAVKLLAKSWKGFLISTGVGVGLIALEFILTRFTNVLGEAKEPVEEMAKSLEGAAKKVFEFKEEGEEIPKITKNVKDLEEAFGNLESALKKLTLIHAESFRSTKILIEKLSSELEIRKKGLEELGVIEAGRARLQLAGRDLEAENVWDMNNKSIDERATLLDKLKVKYGNIRRAIGILGRLHTKEGQIYREEQRKRIKLLEDSLRHHTALITRFGSLEEGAKELAKVLEFIKTPEDELREFRNDLNLLAEHTEFTFGQVEVAWKKAFDASVLGEPLKQLEKMKNKVFEIVNGLDEFQIAQREFEKLRGVTPFQVEKFKKFLNELRKEREKFIEQKPTKETIKGPEAGRFGFGAMGRHIQDAILKRDDTSKKILKRNEEQVKELRSIDENTLKISKMKFTAGLV